MAPLRDFIFAELWISDGLFENQDPSQWIPFKNFVPFGPRHHNASLLDQFEANFDAPLFLFSGLQRQQHPTNYMYWK